MEAPLKFAPKFLYIKCGADHCGSRGFKEYSTRPPFRSDSIPHLRSKPHCISQQSNLLGLIKMTYEDVMGDLYTLLLIDLTFSMNRTKLPFSIIRACNFVEHRMDDLIRSHMRKITTSEGEFWKIFILPVLLLPWYSPPS